MVYGVMTRDLWQSLCYVCENTLIHDGLQALIVQTHEKIEYKIKAKGLRES